MRALNYAYINYPMSEMLKENANSYIEGNYGITIFEYNGNLLDIKSLNRLVNLDCMNCHLAHTQLCCDGSPYPPVQEDLDKVLNNKESILKESQSCSDYCNSKKHLDINGGPLNKEGSFIEVEGKCLFSVKLEDNETHVCAIHKYAEMKNNSYTDLKPRGCMMYPLDVIHLEECGDFIFGADDETIVETVLQFYKGEMAYCSSRDNKGFSRWNSNDLQYICLNKDARIKIFETRKAQSSFSKGTLPDNVFLLENYKPTYQQEEKLIVSLYGQDTYDFIKMKSLELIDSGVITP